MIKELSRYDTKKLQELESHTSADCRSGEIGDIDILTKENIPCEGVEVKYGKPITAHMIKDAFEKFKQYPVERYYLLSTVKSTDHEDIDKAILDIKKELCEFTSGSIIYYTLSFIVFIPYIW